ncbi:MAG: hypothetical protein JXA33_01820 [Anaerolineae bacterium]|nr:hypothetical protein [Anaerolineae bacterium]
MLLSLRCTPTPESTFNAQSITNEATINTSRSPILQTPTAISVSIPHPTLPMAEPLPATVFVAPSLQSVPTVRAGASSTVSVFDYYGLAYAYPKNRWTETDRLAIRERLEYFQGLGINIIIQNFSSQWIGEKEAENWLVFLDEAERANLYVIARLWPSVEWDGQNFNFQAIQGFVSIVQHHPALFAYLGLHEPLEQFNCDQLRTFYAGVKAFAPDLRIVHYMGDMAWFENNPLFPNRNFSNGICDICIIWYYPFRYMNGVPVFEQDLVQQTLRTNRALVNERAPEVQLWFLGQGYAMDKHKRQLRMPLPQEMEKLYVIANQEQVDGFIWYPWYHNSYDQVLSDSDMEPQRQAIYHIYKTYIALEKQE